MRKLILLIPAACLLVASCSSVRYGDAEATETVTIDWGSTDLQTFANHMSDSLLADRDLDYIDVETKGTDKRIVAVFGGIANETTEHINTNQISRKILSNLDDSGKFRFVAGDEAAGQEEIGKQIRFQQGSGRVDPDQAHAFRQLGADVVIYGSLSSITKERGRSLESLGSKRLDSYYQFFMTAVNVTTGEILWTEEEDIRKTATVSLFGRG